MVAGTVLLHLIFNGLGKEVWGHTRPLEFATYCRAKWIGQLGNLWCLGIGNSLPIKLVVLLLPVTVSSGGIFRKLFADGLVYAPYDVGLVLQSPSNLKCVIDGANQFMTMFGHTNKKQAALTLKRCVTQLTGTKKKEKLLHDVRRNNLTLFDKPEFITLLSSIWRGPRLSSFPLSCATNASLASCFTATFSTISVFQWFVFLQLF